MAERTDWNPVLRGELAKPYWQDLQRFVAEERARAEVYPPPDQVFAALHLTPYAEVKVLILGQDPYHGPGQAHGLCFSVQPGVPAPPSLVNILKELHDDIGVAPPVQRQRAERPQSTGSRPASTRAAFARENGRLPKNPLWADRGEGWADSMTTWRVVSMRARFLRADAPHRMNTTRSGFAFTARITSSVKVSQPLPW